MNIIDRLKQLAALWRKRAEAVELKYEAASPVQSKLVSESYRERADELDMIIEEAERGM